MKKNQWRAFRVEEKRERKMDEQDLAESQTSSLPHAGVDRRDAGLQNGNHLQENPLSILLAQLSESPRSSLKKKKKVAVISEARNEWEEKRRRTSRCSSPGLAKRAMTWLMTEGRISRTVKGGRRRVSGA